MDYKTLHSLQKKALHVAVVVLATLTGPAWSLQATETSPSVTQAVETTVEEEESTTTQVEKPETTQTTAPITAGETTVASETTVDPTQTTTDGSETSLDSETSLSEAEALIEGSTYGQEVYQPPAVLQEKVNEAKVKFDKAAADYQTSIEEVQALRIRRKTITVELDQLHDKNKELVTEVARLEKAIVTKALLEYQFAAMVEPQAPADYEGNLQGYAQEALLEQLITVDEDQVDQYKGKRVLLDEKSSSLRERQKVMDSLVVAAQEAAEEVKVDYDQALIEHQAFEAGSQVFISGVVFPIAGDYPTPLIDSYGFPRMPGTKDAHWHEGIDIFAPRNTPLVAAEGGTVTDVGVGRLGGLKVWVRGDSGTEWYYAHLENFAPGLAEGQTVKAGDLLGYIGDSGNAVGTPPHVHLEMHPGGGGPVNPYPLLYIVSQVDQEAKANGTHKGYQVEPVAEPEKDPSIK